MKKASLGIFLLVMLFSSLEGKAQQADRILSNFSGFEVDGIVYLTATIATGNTCNGIDLFKSTDNYNFQYIGDIPGICGSSSHPVRYDFIDSVPHLNEINYYKLELGGQGNTMPIAIEVRSFTNEKVQVHPNPIRETGIIRFSNPEYHVMEIQITNAQGQVVLNQTSKYQSLDVSLENWRHGMYWIRVSNTETGSQQSGILVKI